MTSYIRVFAIENFIMAEIVQPSDKIKFIFILFSLRTCMIKSRQMYHTDLYGTIYTGNIQNAVVICLIIPKIFPFDAESSFILSDGRKNSIVKFSITKTPGCMTYVVHPGFVDRCLSFGTFSFNHCIVCSSSIYGFWYLQTLLSHAVCVVYISSDVFIY